MEVGKCQKEPKQQHKGAVLLWLEQVQLEGLDAVVNQLRVSP